MLRNGLAPKGTIEAVGEEFRQGIDACRGEQELRRNAVELKRKFEKAWEDGGEARREVNAFLDWQSKDCSQSTLCRNIERECHMCLDLGDR